MGTNDHCRIHRSRRMGVVQYRYLAVGGFAKGRGRAVDPHPTTRGRYCSIGNLRRDWLRAKLPNIIALPALLGIGVAFKIYYVIEWRAGETNFLQSTITRAVFFSALMTATAFGSLWLSNQPGISSMGLLLALSLACTLASAALFQPALMGAPRSA